MFKIVSTKLVFLLLLTGRVHAQDKGMQFSPWFLARTVDRSEKINKLIFVDVYTEWCGPCKMMAKDVFPLQQVGEKYNSQFINYKLDAEKGKGSNCRKNSRCRAIPLISISTAGAICCTVALDFLSRISSLRMPMWPWLQPVILVSIGSLTQEYESGKRTRNS